ncbi:aspartate carbamoyltransferase catalytic subunit [Natranaerofaba carboxydovora]|uniref:aspartate carbamoyltransferase catalytic subunit n=1 Tax=Natranaerofaba carboxydovora TaxID=2742683 RepID=UPI001F128D11|nr:aspartate carbamoyltransferase catalytic subunit [Natranaerofaba carboxydovora]UMZ73875.1 Aspartate carbamoyltransferase [Natranaerofaba carboxydovora]
MTISRKDLLNMRDLSAAEVNTILDTAESMEEIIYRDVKKLPTLKGKSIINLFYEPSTRTRSSFELAGKYLGADMVNMNANVSSIKKGETLIDTARTLEAMGVDMIIIRHPVSGAPGLLAKSVNARVLNAGDGCHAHPTQALLDMYTMRKKFKSFEGLNVVILGDIAHSRVARSNIWGLIKMGAKVTLCAPNTLLPVEIKKMGVNVTSSLEDALQFADVMMALRVQFERQDESFFPSSREYAKYYGLNKEKLKHAKDSLMIMHPGPINRGIEISPEVYDSENSVIDEQVTGGVAIRMALLYLMGGEYDEAQNS